MDDPFLSPDNQEDRLWNDYVTHGTLIVAFDFDNTVYDFHNKGYMFPKIIKLLKQCNKLNFSLIVFTSNKDHGFIKEYLTELDISYYSINKSPVETCSTAEKPYFNILLDDRAGLLSAYTTLNAVITRITNG